MAATMILEVGWEEKLAEKLKGTSMGRSLNGRVKEITKLIVTGQAVVKEDEDDTGSQSN